MGPLSVMVVAALIILGYRWVELVGALGEKGCSGFQHRFVMFVCFSLGLMVGIKQGPAEFS